MTPEILPTNPDEHHPTTEEIRDDIKATPTIFEPQGKTYGSTSPQGLTKGEKAAFNRILDKIEQGTSHY